MSSEPRPLFIYGTLCALPLLAWAMTGEITKIDEVRPLLRKAMVHGYKRCSLHGRDYPAAIQDTGSSVDGYLLAPQTTSQRRKLDDFEGETYKITQVMVTILDNDGQPTGDIVEADMYVWDQDLDTVSLEAPWDLDTFVRERLEDWLDLFEGIELVGDDIDD
ncbi:hypothetical protein QBC46DRAFT_298790 [Diplogelasinospora grovesii]|uniref:Putative gamma-glutamylcyclotransferase n=1 Tax=Diplogelasinospora grovesii TaxID=303347 RepID=A0AAN6MY32_9PEZI|nr:hypothetical protein QBC46DRAFT_298790 [Diplogelasinospora grovesii]